MGLQKENFALLDDDQEQVITHFAMDDAPISVGFVFDTSGSMFGKMQKSREAVRTFLNTANPDDEFFLVRFSNRVNLAMDLTKDTEQLQKQIRLIQPSGQTALWDAIHFSISRMRQVKNVRKSLIIVSDGGDNRSRYTRTEIENMVRESDVQIYAIGIFDPVEVRSRIPEEANGPQLLQEVTTQTGGRLFEIDVNQMPELAWKLGWALRAQYLLGYSPNKSRHDGKYHHVEVKLAPSKVSPKMQAYWRRGYYSPAE